MPTFEIRDDNSLRLGTDLLTILDAYVRVNNDVL